MRHLAHSAIGASLFLLSGVAGAQNSEDVVAGTDVALTGGAVVANVHTGGALWFNPAGVARLNARAVDLTGAVLAYTKVRARGALSLESGEQSAGKYSAFQAIPRALTFVASPKPALRWGLGFFFSRVQERFLQDSVSSDEAADPTAEFFASADATKSIYHISSAIGWKKIDKLLIGGGLDIVIASERTSEFLSGAFLGGEAGALSVDAAQRVSGGGLQIKAGLQWAPIPELRIGFMASTPSYLVYLKEEGTVTETRAPSVGPPIFEGSQIDRLEGAWAGVEAGVSRVGAAYLWPGGWVELDLIVRFPLQTPQLGIYWKTIADARVGAIFQITPKLKLGAGFSTDFSAVRSLDSFGESEFDFYRVTAGVNFSNRERPPEPGEGGFYLAFAIAARYSYGTGQVSGVRFAPSFQGPITEPNIVPATANSIGINLAIKAAF